MRHPFCLYFTLAGLLACGADKPAAPAQATIESKPAPSAPAAPSPALAPPETPYVPAQPWHSRKDPNETVAPPDPAQETWRVFANQEQPMQRKTPVWHLLPAGETVAVELQPESGFRCIVTPLQVTAESNEFGSKLKAWMLRRNLLCSADGWHSWTEHPHNVRILADGTRTTTFAGEVLLRERAGSEVRQTVVLVRDDKERREATTGPPRILPGVKVEED